MSLQMKKDSCKNWRKKNSKVASQPLWSKIEPQSKFTWWKQPEPAPVFVSFSAGTLVDVWYVFPTPKEAYPPALPISFEVVPE